MPDQDIFSKGFAKGWKSAARKICKGASPEIAADATARALRRDLKEIGGIPNLSELHNMLIKADNNKNPKAVYELFQELKCYERNSVNRDFADSVKKAIIQIHLESSERNNTHGTLFPTKQQLAEKICAHYIENQLHSKIKILEESEIGRKWQSKNYQEEYDRQLNQCKKEIAKSLAKDPDFNKPPRFSSMREQKFSTEEILHKPISLT